MRVSELVDSVGRMIYCTRATVLSDRTEQFIVGNLRLVDHGPPPYSPLPVAEHLLIEVAIGDTPVEVWKVHRGLQFTEISDDGQALIAIHALFGHLVISEEFQELKNHSVTVAVVQEDPAFGQEWKPTIFALEGQNSQTLSFECYCNTMWKSELFDAANNGGATSVHHASSSGLSRDMRSSAIPVASVGSAHRRGGSFENRQHSARGGGAAGGSSVQSSHSSTMYQQHLSPSLGPQQVIGSLSSNRHGVSPTSFHTTFASMHPMSVSVSNHHHHHPPPSAQSAVPPPLHIVLGSMSFLSRIDKMRPLPVLNESCQFEDDDFVVTISTYDAQKYTDVQLELDLQES
jgi:hypothetical protein